MLVMSHDQALLQERRETTEKALTFLYPFQWFQAGTVLRKDTENLQVDTPHRVHVDMSRANAVLHGPPPSTGHSSLKLRYTAAKQPRNTTHQHNKGGLKHVALAWTH